MKIEACFDSHVHWAATGEFAQRLRLDELKFARDVKDLKLLPHHARGEWLIGFGWDDNGWTEAPTRQVLDQVFPDRPVAFSRCDGHALWVNSEALKRAGLLAKSPTSVEGGRIVVDSQGFATGVLIDQATAAVDRLIPTVGGADLRRNLLKGVKTFNDAGYTHIRDMTCNESQWNEAVRLDESGLLTLAVEEYFWVKRTDELSATLATALKAKQTPSKNLRVMGLKFFLDGALGSEGAWLSRCYHGGEQSGLRLWSDQDLREALAKTWEAGLEAAVHAIGDEAAQCVVQVALALKAEGKSGKLHIEHAELLRPETIDTMKNLNVECHLQPAHWLSDRKWLKEKVGDLAQYAFPWRRLQEADVPFHFGSDSPIEPASLMRTFQALRESAEAGIPRLLGNAMNYMSHSDLSWAPNSFTLLSDDESPHQIVFRGEHLI